MSDLTTDASPAGTPHRRALVVAADDPVARATVGGIIDHDPQTMTFLHVSSVGVRPTGGKTKSLGEIGFSLISGSDQGILKLLHCRIAWSGLTAGRRCEWDGPGFFLGFLVSGYIVAFLIICPLPIQRDAPSGKRTCTGRVLPGSNRDGRSTTPLGPHSKSAAGQAARTSSRAGVRSFFRRAGKLPL